MSVARSDVTEAVESQTFEILMESVLKMSKLMNVSVFLLVENRLRQRCYGGSDAFCLAYSKGRMRARAGDLRLGVEDLDAEVEEEDWLARVEDVDEESVKSRRSDVDYVPDEYDDVASNENDDVSEFSLSTHDGRTRRHRPKKKSNRRNFSSSPEERGADDYDDGVVVGDEGGCGANDADFARQIRDYAEGRGGYEDSWDADVVEFLRFQDDDDDDDDYRRDVNRVDDVVDHDDTSATDDEWKPVNYGKGKIYQRERRKYISKEKKRKARMSEEAAAAATSANSDKKPFKVEKSESAAPEADKKNYTSGSCPYCDQHFNKLKQHVQDVHECERKYSCEICAKRFKRDSHLRQHLKGVHKIYLN